MATIMIVDDVPSEAQLMSSVVRALGHNSVIVSDGDAALSAAKTTSPSLILMDVVMPGMNGFETCRKIHRDKETANIPVVMVTTKNQDTDKFWATKQGAVGFVTKPFTAETLASVIREQLG